MGKDYQSIVQDIARELADHITERIEEGGHSKVYFGNKFVYKITEKKVMEKSSRINSILSNISETSLLDHIPKTVICKDLGEHSLVVEELKDGSHPINIDLELLKEILGFLNRVHQIDIDQTLTNFEGDSIPVAKYWESQLESAEQYASKLRCSATFTEADTELVESCLRTIKEISLKEASPPRLVLVYKDVHRHNTLVDQNNRLSALIDWDAAMSGPVELEYVVLWARFRDLWPQLQDYLGIKLNKDLFIMAGLVQGLRFWKSFTKDSNYVEEQRRSLKELLELYESNTKDWQSEL